MLTQPGPSLTDLALGLLTLALLPAVRRPGVNRYWRATVWCAGIAALAGAVHHGFIVRSERWAGPSWALVSVVVVVTISFTLAATVADLLTPRQARVFAGLRVVSLGSYAALAATGHYGVTTILACESVTMAAVVVLWIARAAAWRSPGAEHGDRLRRQRRCRRHARRAGGVDPLVGLDPVSLYHLAQMPAMVMLCLALHHRAATDPTGRCPRPPHRERFGRRSGRARAGRRRGDLLPAPRPGSACRW